MKKLNKKGFTLIEILVSFTLVMIILLNLFSVVMAYRDRASITSLREDYNTFKSLVTKDVHNDILKKKLTSITELAASACSADATTRCYQFRFGDGSIKNLFVSNHQTAAGVRDKYLQYGDQKYRIRDDIPDNNMIPAGKTVLDYQNVTIEADPLKRTVSGGRTIYTIKIHLYHHELDEDFGLDLVTIV